MNNRDYSVKSEEVGGFAGSKVRTFRGPEVLGFAVLVRVMYQRVPVVDRPADGTAGHH
jgi:hypothetical protein